MVLSLIGMRTLIFVGLDFALHNCRIASDVVKMVRFIEFN